MVIRGKNIDSRHIVAALIFPAVTVTAASMTDLGPAFPVAAGVIGLLVGVPVSLTFVPRWRDEKHAPWMGAFIMGLAAVVAISVGVVVMT